MISKSIWSETTTPKDRRPLPGDMVVDTVIIGGGMAGILTAYFLGQRGRECIVLEANRVGRGQTKNTTAKITSQHNLIYSKLLKNLGKNQARQYADANQEAIQQYKHLIQGEHISCEWKECPAYLYTTEDEALLREEFDAAAALGLPAELRRQTELPFDVRRALCFEGQARFHPLCFLYHIAEQVTVYEHTVVTKVDEQEVYTNHGKVQAKHIVFAGHYPFVNVPGYYFLKMHQERSYVLALENAADIEGMYLGIGGEGLSFREANGQLLIGGGGHRTGEHPAGGSYEYLRHMAWKYWPDCRETARWSAQDCMTLDGIPYIGTYADSRKNWYVATGFGKWGMTSSMVSAMIISDQICGEDNPYAEVFAPQRMHVAMSAKTFLSEGAHAASGLLRQLGQIPKELTEHLRPGHGGIVEYEGEKCGVYKDEKGHIYVVSTKCPHLGCQLTWNPDENSFDCPCHGSRFDYRGNRMDGPAQENIPLGGEGV